MTAATRSTRQSCERSAGHRGASGRTASARRSTGTASTATGGSRSNAPTASATSTSGSTRRGSHDLTVLLSLGAEPVDRGLAPFDRLRLVEQVEHARAVAEMEPRVGEVVLRVRLVEDARAFEPLHRLLEQWKRARIVAALHLREAGVVERNAALSRRRRRR